MNPLQQNASLVYQHPMLIKTDEIGSVSQKIHKETTNKVEEKFINKANNSWHIRELCKWLWQKFLDALVIVFEYVKLFGKKLKPICVKIFDKYVIYFFSTVYNAPVNNFISCDNFEQLKQVTRQQRSKTRTYILLSKKCKYRNLVDALNYSRQKGYRFSVLRNALK